MAEPAYEYWGLMASTWDLLRGDTSHWPDRAFYRTLVEREGQPVLDVGCGGGRLLIDYLEQGIDIDGVDNSPELLAICRQRAAALGKQPGLYVQPMQALDLPRRYQVILVPSSSFQLLTNPTDARAALERFYAHLLTGGVLAMSIMDFWRPGDPLDSGLNLAAEAVRREDGATVRRWVRETFDPATRLESTENVFEVLVDGVIVQREAHVQSPATRAYTLAEALARPAAAGFTEIKAYSEFTWQPATAADRLFTLVCRR